MPELGKPGAVKKVTSSRMQLPYPTSLEKSGKNYLLALEVEFCLQCSKLYNSHWCKLLLNLSQNTENMLLPVRQLNAQ